MSMMPAYRIVNTTYQLHLGRRIEMPQLGIDEFRVVSDADMYQFIKATVLDWFPSFTLTNTTSYWKGQLEDVTIIQIISDDYDDALKIHQIAEDYKKRFYQEAVLVNTFSSFPNII